VRPNILSIWSYYLCSFLLCFELGTLLHNAAGLTLSVLIGWCFIHITQAAEVPRSVFSSLSQHVLGYRSSVVTAKCTLMRALRIHLSRVFSRILVQVAVSPHLLRTSHFRECLIQSGIRFQVKVSTMFWVICFSDTSHVVLTMLCNRVHPQHHDISRFVSSFDSTRCFCSPFCNCFTQSDRIKMTWRPTMTFGKNKVTKSVPGRSGYWTNWAVS
jgi:hypothetical protein